MIAIVTGKCLRQSVRRSEIEMKEKSRVLWVSSSRKQRSDNEIEEKKQKEVNKEVIDSHGQTRFETLILFMTGV